MTLLPQIARFTFSALLLSALAGCTYLIPPDPSTPRYNNVDGPRHAPAQNSNVGPSAANAATPAPVEPLKVAVAEPLPPAPLPAKEASVAAADVPPPAPPAVAETAAMAPDARRAPAAQFAAAAPELPSPPPAPVVIGRQVPVENQAFQLATADAGLTSVPPRPTTTPSAGLKESQKELEQAREINSVAKNKLTKDAAQEPPILPPAVTPPPPPLPPAPPQAKAAPVAAPAPVVAVAPPAPLPPAPVAEKVTVVPLAPPPVMAQTPAPAPAPMQTASAAATYPRGDFDPLATAPAAASAAGAAAATGFLPASRYAARR